MNFNKMTRQVDIKAILSHIIRGDGLNKCRICMGDTKDGFIHLGDTVMFDGEKAITLSEILEIITGIEMVFEENLPMGLCPTCAMSALNAANFRTLCHQAVNQWKLTIQLLNKLPSLNKKSMLAIIENNQMLIINTDRNLPRSDVFIFDESTNMTTEETYECMECKKRFLHPFQLYYHLKESNTHQACFKCGKIMLGEDLPSHIENTHNDKVFTCNQCLKLFFSYEQYEQHNEQAHTNGMVCVVCAYSFQSKHALDEHMLIHQSKICPTCGNTFQNKACHLHHIKLCCNMDKKQHNIKCITQKASVMKQRKNEKIKIERNHSKKQCTCDYCGKIFAGKKFVSAHIQIVHLKNTHRPCTYCGKLLAAAHMTEHVKKHITNSSYTCDNCGVVLKSKLGYIQHKRLHTGERPYPCKYCVETFSASSRRSEHIRKMHKSKDILLNHVCAQCPARFRLPYRLQKHMISVHKNAPPHSEKFECSDCPDVFYSHRGLLHHNRRKHQVVVDFVKNKL